MRLIGSNRRSISSLPKRGVRESSTESSTGGSKPVRPVWDDFELGRKQKGKQVFLKNRDNRLVPETAQKQKLELHGQDSGFRESSGVMSSEETHSPDRHRSDYEAIETSIGFKFSSKELLERALTHRSALHQRERTDYERLEFLGDAVLSLCVAHLLSEHHPEANEGTLSKMRAALVNTQALASIAKELDLGSFVRLGRGESTSGGRERPSILADVTEAIFGAIYHDGGFEAALNASNKIFGSQLDRVSCSDPKTDLQEQLHLEGSEAPSYLVEMVEGPVHAPTFVTVVMVDGVIAGRGKGTTKKAAHQSAASEVLSKLRYSYAPLDLVEGQTILIRDLLMTCSIIADLPALDIPVPTTVDSELVVSEGPIVTDSPVPDSIDSDSADGSL